MVQATSDAMIRYRVKVSGKEEIVSKTSRGK